MRFTARYAYFGENSLLPVKEDLTCVAVLWRESKGEIRLIEVISEHLVDNQHGSNQTSFLVIRENIY
jgi:hypothetical protein